MAAKNLSILKQKDGLERCLTEISKNQGMSQKLCKLLPKREKIHDLICEDLIKHKKYILFQKQKLMKGKKSKEEPKQNSKQVAIKPRRSASQVEKDKEFKNLILTQKRISDMQILNQNIKRKLSLYNNLLPSKTSVNLTERLQPVTKRSSYESPLKVKQSKRQQKFTNYEKNVISQYSKQLKDSEKQRNPFEIALVEMIEKQQEMVLKRKKDKEFWQNRIKQLELTYQKLNKGIMSFQSEEA